MTKKAKKRPDSLKIPNVIIYTAKFLQLFSRKWCTKFCARLFTTPIRHKIPKREHDMESRSKQQLIFVPSIAKEVMLYTFGSGPKKILLAHGWSGRGTQLVKIAERLVEEGYTTYSFDAPAHGKSSGSTTLMPEFIASILEIEKQFGPFEAAVGYSLGGMSLLNAVKRGFDIKKLVTIGSGDKISDILLDFTRRMKLDNKVADEMRDYFEASFIGETMEGYSAYIAAKEVEIPVLVIHDNDDFEVPAKCAINIHKHLPDGQLMLTKGLGHRKILGDPAVIEQTLDFIKNNTL
ncbi:MAG: alpha/beta hydrolase [Flavobacterium sp.]|uniref:alpha/beta fold hydrolase n=1 Tax=Flavobacterium sp. TaxID=239 RepID=UPI001229B8FD|nr:alpha/beta hydrolase [Flavobacterium sp.]RZJ66606.1 MAG: alpha/beta hydrolase [Flavobacterium sp.]